LIHTLKQEVMTKLEVDDPALIVPVLTDVVKVIRLVPQMQRFIEKVNQTVWSSPASQASTVTATIGGGRKGGRGHGQDTLKTLLDTPQKLGSTLERLEEWRILVEALMPMARSVGDEGGGDGGGGGDKLSREQRKRERDRRGAR